MAAFLIMHGEKCVAALEKSGACRLFEPRFIPYNLYLEEGTDTETLVNNIVNFRYWCATRVLTLDRKYAKEILNSIGASQGNTDAERAGVALSYHCLTLTDVFWVKEESDPALFSDINLFDHHLDNAFVDIALKGRQMTVENAHLIADDVSTPGLFPKAWVREKDGTFRLYKDGDKDAVALELLAGRICSHFDCPQVRYEKAFYDGQEVSACEIMTSHKYGIVTREAFDIHARNHDMDPLQCILQLDAHGYYMMNLLDYLVGNTDRHWGNWGLLIDNSTNLPVRLHDLMDFNRAFQAYDTIEGANCETALPKIMTQAEAAKEAVRNNGLHLLNDIPEDYFRDYPHLYDMFSKRLKLVKEWTVSA